MNNVTEQLDVDRLRGEMSFGGNEHVFHCDYFNVFFQMTFEEANVDGREIIRDEARATIPESVSAIVAEDMEPEEKASKLEEFFSTVAAMGTVDLPVEFRTGDTLVVEDSYWGKSWKKLYGEQGDTKCKFVEGTLEAFAGIITDSSPYEFTIREEQCIAQGHDQCEFKVIRE